MEESPDFVGSLSLDHFRYPLGPQIPAFQRGVRWTRAYITCLVTDSGLQQRSDIQIVGGENKLKKELLVHVYKLGIPRIYMLGRWSLLR